MINCEIPFENMFPYTIGKYAKEHKIPVSATIELTPFCNFKCVMCYVRLDAEQAKKQGEILTKEEIEILFEGLPRVEMTEDTLLIDSLVSLKAASSKREARDFINGGGVLVNGVQQKSLEFVISKENAIGNTYTVIRRGKKNYYLIEHK